MCWLPCSNLCFVLDGQAGTRESPMVFVDDEYIGNCRYPHSFVIPYPFAHTRFCADPDITELHSTGELTRILNY